MPRYVRALYTSHITPYIQIVAGELWGADDPFVLAHPECFDANLEAVARRTVAPPVEEPRRGPGRPRKIETTEKDIEVTA